MNTPRARHQHTLETRRQRRPSRASRSLSRSTRGFLTKALSMVGAAAACGAGPNDGSDSRYQPAAWHLVSLECGPVDTRRWTRSIRKVRQSAPACGSQATRYQKILGWEPAKDQHIPGAGRSVEARFLPIRSEHCAAWTRGYVRYRRNVPLPWFSAHANSFAVECRRAACGSPRTLATPLGADTVHRCGFVSVRCRTNDCHLGGTADRKKGTTHATPGNEQTNGFEHAGGATKCRNELGERVDRRFLQRRRYALKTACTPRRASDAFRTHHTCATLSPATCAVTRAPVPIESLRIFGHIATPN
jgi:hypothetical protein